jgi:hypothetical protein
VNFTVNELKALKPGNVLVLDATAPARVVSLQKFSDVQCDGL